MFWLGAIVSLCYVPGITGAYIATQWPVLAAILPLLLLRREGPFTVFHALGVLFLAYATVHLWFTPTPQTSVFGLWMVIIMGLCLWFGTTLANVRGLYAGLAAGAAVSSAVAVAQFAGWGIVPRSSELPAGIFVNSVQHGTVLAIIAVALVSERMWLWMLPLLPGIALSGSRGATFVLAIGLFGCCVRRVWVLGAAVAVVTAFYTLAPLGPSDLQRMQIWTAAWNNLTWLGWGPGVFFTLLLTAADGKLYYPEYAHNDALQLAFEYGAVAVLPFAIFAFALVCTGAREWPVVLAFVAAGCFSMPMYMPVASFLGFVVVGRVLREHALVRRSRGVRGFDFVPWRHSRAETSGRIVPMASRT